MSYEERKLMDLTDKIILEANPEELSDLQQIDINTQLNGVWFYDVYNRSNQIKKNHNITAKKLFSK